MRVIWFIFRCFSIFIYGKFNSNFLVIFFATFFLLARKLLKWVFSHFLLVDNFYESSLSIMQHILEMSRGLSIILCLRSFRIANYGKFNPYWFQLFILFFWSVIFTRLVCELYLLFETILDLKVLFILEVFIGAILSRFSGL